MNIAARPLPGESELPPFCNRMGCFPEEGIAVDGIQLLKVQPCYRVGLVDEEGECDGLTGGIVATNGDANAGWIIGPFGMETVNLAWSKFTAKRREVRRAVRERGSGGDRALCCKLYAHCRVGDGEARNPSVHQVFHCVGTDDAN